MNKIIRNIVLWVLAVLFIFIIVTRRAEVENVLQVLLKGKWQWIAVAAFSQLFYFFLYTFMYKISFELVGVKSKVKELLPTIFSAIFVGVTVPVGGISGSILLIDDASRNGNSAARAAVGTIIAMLSEFVTFAVVLFIGLLYLHLHGLLSLYEGMAAVGIFVVILILTFFLFLGLWHPGKLHSVFHWLQKIVNKISVWFRKTTFFAEDWAHKSSAEFSLAVSNIRKKPEAVLRILIVSFGLHVSGVFCILFIFLAFYKPVGFGVLIAAYSMAVLFKVVSPVPQGIGVVEGVMTLVLISVGVPGRVATVVSVAYRGLSFWIPLGLGFVFLKRTKSFGGPHRT